MVPDCWSTGRCGWRPADRWLRGQYPRVANSVVSPNSLFGSMALNGAACVHQLAAQWPDAMISETHPKVGYHATVGFDACTGLGVPDGTALLALLTP